MHDFIGENGEPKQPHIDFNPFAKDGSRLYHKYSVCDCCGGGMDSGWYFMWFDYNYICSEECLLQMPDDTGKQNWTMESYEKFFDEMEADGGSDDTYWTEWEDGCDMDLEDCEICQQIQYENGEINV